MSFFLIDNNGFSWTGDGEYLRVEAWGTDSVRVRARRMQPPEDTDWALLPLDDIIADEENLRVSISSECIDEHREILTLINGALTVRAQAQRCRNDASGYPEFMCSLSFYNNDTLIMQEISRGGSLNMRAREYYAPSGNGYATRVRLQTPKDEHLYGMGEYQQNIMDLKGASLELAHRNSQASVPFVVSSAGYGFLWNNPAIGSVHFGANYNTWEAQSTIQIDYWITVGQTPAQIERHYAQVTGYAPVMPDWALGFWQCKLRYWNQEQLLQVARTFKDKGIPLDVIVADFFHWPHMGDYRFEDEFWPDPKAMCDELHEMGTKLMVSIWPQVSFQSENYAEMRRRNLLISADRGVDIGMMFEGASQYYDATNPEARQFVWDLCKKNYIDKGVDAFWLDEAEPEYAVYSYDNYRYWAGPNIQIGNKYPMDYNRGFYEGQVQAGNEGNIVNLTRCAWAGSQRYGALVWSGDVGSTFEDLKSQITCAIHMGMAGIPWFTTDMGGFHDGDITSEEFRELFIRWCQFSCFSPIMRNHGDRSCGVDIATSKEKVFAADGTHRAQSGADNEPWSMGSHIEAIVCKYITIRQLLKPYTKQLFNEAHTDGQPVVRGLFYEFPHDAAAANISDEYMYGSDLLVAPIVEAHARSRTVYLPGGHHVIWTDVRNGKTFVGGEYIDIDAQLEEIPVFARDGQDHGLLYRL